MKKNRSFNLASFYGWLAVAWVIILLILLVAHNPKAKIQTIKMVGTINGTILSYEKELPGCLIVNAMANGKNDIEYGPIYQGEDNGFLDRAELKKYRHLHPRDIIWIHRPDRGRVKIILIILEKGTTPDLKFLKIIE